MESLPLSKTYRFNRCQMNTGRRELLVDGVAVELQPLVFDMLVYLVERPGQVVVKDELLSEVWRSRFVTESAVARAVMKARRAIGDDAREPTMLRTVQRVGYRLDALVLTGAEVPPQPFESLVAGAPARSGLVLMPCVNEVGDAHLQRVSKNVPDLLQHLLLAGDASGEVKVGEVREHPLAPDEDALAEACVRGGTREALALRVSGEPGRLRLEARRGSNAANARRFEYVGKDMVQLVVRLADEQHGIAHGRPVELRVAAPAPAVPEVAPELAPEPAAEVAPEAAQDAAADDADFWTERLTQVMALADQGLLGAAGELLDVCAPHVPQSLTLKLLQASLSRFAGRYKESREHGRMALRLATQAGSPELQVQALGELAAATYRLNELQGALAHCNEALAIVRQHPVAQGRIALVLNGMADLYCAMGLAEQSVYWSERAVATAIDAGQTEFEWLARAVHGLCLLVAGRSLRAQEVLERTIEHVRRNRMLRVEVVATYFLVLMETMRCRYKLALELSRRAQALSSMAGHVFIREMAQIEEINVLVRLGRLDEALAGVRRIRMESLSAVATRAMFAQARANALWRSGAREEAVEQQARLVAGLAHAKSRIWVQAGLELCMNWLALGRPERAETTLQGLTGTQLPGPAGRAYAALALYRGDRARCLDLLQECWARLPLDDMQGVLLAHDIAWMLLEDGRIEDIEVMMTQISELTEHFLPARVLDAACAAVRQPPQQLRRSDWTDAISETPALLRSFPFLADDGYIDQLRCGQAPRVNQLLIQACW